ncbi:MAG: MoxR family ATPase [Victivallaceae bacterium]|nr:MoxR family ATPase [Victivallaceae bacterium]
MQNKLNDLKQNIIKVIQGKDDVVGQLLVALCAGGNILMEDVPGVGKTTLAKALAASINGKFNRVQFTPDLLPADILGSSIYNPKNGEFVFREGPVFTNILLADEINRASPRTQSALLEAMSERQVSIEGRTMPLPHPFLVIATENPIEYQGTYSLPEAQLDRFSMQLELGYPDENYELEILFSHKECEPLENIVQVMSCDDIAAIQQQVRQINIETSVAKYLVKLIRATRDDVRISLGASPRALLTLTRCCQASAFIAGRDYIMPNDVKKLAVSALSHRIILENKAKYAGIKSTTVVSEIVDGLKAPR